MTAGSLFRRIFVLNAVVFAVGTAILAASPATVSFPIALTEAVVLLGGLSVMLLANAFLLRLGLAPLVKLVEEMRRLDLLRPGARLRPAGAREAAVVIDTFNDMLARLEQERREASGRTLAAQEAERRRIAQGIHDEVGQSLTAVILQLQRIAVRAPDEVRAELLDAQQTARASLDEVRRIARELRPEALDHLGLVPALTTLASTFSRRTGIRVDRRLEAVGELEPDVELAVYRIAQEALTNVARHAHAQVATVTLERANGSLVLQVADDGVGVPAGAPAGGGVRGMHERAFLIGGRVRVDGVGGGTRVRLEAPCRSR